MAKGREYRVSAAGQAALESARADAQSCTGPIPAGSFCTKELAFEVPADIGKAHLRISWGGAMIDLLDLVFSGDKRIALR